MGNSSDINWRAYSGYSREVESRKVSILRLDKLTLKELGQELRDFIKMQEHKLKLRREARIEPKLEKV
ncbi:MAG: hypothetical protein EAZ25_05755 [Oscillatoriales cyanobacterium]|nr:MAG: hypothetical protein EAZ25_05755 [Oscillatoriales cyanobacterium]